MNWSLSKSRVVAGMICPRRLWLLTHRPDLPRQPLTAGGRKSIADGHAVGELAQNQYRNGLLLDVNTRNLEANIRQTAEYLSAPGDLTLFEAGFKANGVLVLLDVLERHGSDLHLIEVKASTNLKDYHRDDIAVQAYVMREAGFAPARIVVRHPDKQFIYQGDGDYSALLTDEDLTEDAAARHDEIAQTLAELRTMLDGDEPRTEIGSQCKKPFACDFADYCRMKADLPEYPIQDVIPRASQLKIVRQLRAEGFRDIRDVPAERFDKPLHRVIRDTCATGKPFLDPAARVEMEKHGYPRYFLDFEGVLDPIPRWAGTRPYQQLPFQWSLHVQASPGAPTTHAEFLHTTTDAPMRPAMTRLIDAIGDAGSVFVYHQDYEKGILRTCGELLPDLAPRLHAIVDRIVDLEDIANPHYYHPDMMGSWSIKAVLPTIAPDMNYDDLEEVQDGMSAMVAFLEMIEPETPAQRKEELRQRLLRYCAMDSEAMVRLAHFLEAGTR